MSWLESVDRVLVGQFTFPLVNYLLNRRHILPTYRTLCASERWPAERLHELQLSKLRTVLRHAYEACPYYRKRFQALGLVPEDIRSLDDIRRIPALSRQELTEHHQEMVDARYTDSVLRAERSRPNPGTPVWFAPFRRHKLIRNTSTGSTGTPTIFYDDGSTTALSWAHELRLKSWYGFAPGAREARLARVSAEYVAGSLMVRARRLLWKQLVLPGMNLIDRDYALCWEKIQQFRPSVLWGITSALTGLADYVRRTKPRGSGWRPELVVSWAAPLFEHEKQLLAEVFGSPISNVYGSREVGHVAAVCPAGSLHINQEDFLVEVEAAAEGSPGEILVTTLYPSPMPFLRYSIGDLGEWAPGACACGRTLARLGDVLGRTSDVFITRDGRMIAPNFWCRVFMVNGPSEAVARFQVVYRKNDTVRLRIVPKPNYSAETEAVIRRFLDKNFSGRISFEFEYVSEIKPQASGKYELVVQEGS